MPLQLYTRAEQVAAHLRDEILKGRWSGSLPGILNLGKELGVNHYTIDAALRLLEEEKLLESQGSGKPRRILPLCSSGSRSSRSRPSRGSAGFPGCRWRECRRAKIRRCSFWCV